MREVAELLESEYDIDDSHDTVYKSVREMREAGVFRDTILPNEAYYRFALFEFTLTPEGFADGWRDAMAHVRDERHTLFYFLADGEYQ
jgi:hypothetical protein